jgi:hypothetical protein
MRGASGLFTDERSLTLTYTQKRSADAATLWGDSEAVAAAIAPLCDVLSHEVEQVIDVEWLRNDIISGDLGGALV